MKNGSWVSITGAFIGAVATACGGTSTDDSTMEANDSAGAGTAASSESESPYLFRDPSNSGLRLDVIEAAGNIAVSVGGPIGTENDVLPGLRPDSSLVELYRALHPTESEVPSELEALDELLSPLRRDMVASARKDAPPVAAVEKSQSAFNSTVCKTFREGASQYTPVVCKWKANTQVIQPENALGIFSGDRVYGWNNASSQAQIQFFTCFTNCPPIVAATLPPFWWTFAWMTGGGPYTALLKQTAPSPNPGGDRGATHHGLSFIIR